MTGDLGSSSCNCEHSIYIVWEFGMFFLFEVVVTSCEILGVKALLDFIFISPEQKENSMEQSF